MPLYWLVYRHNNSISVVIEPGHSLIYARLRAAIAGLDQGEFTEGHELPGKWKVAKEMVGRRLSQADAERLLAKLD
jgi:hypothetical protein